MSQENKGHHLHYQHPSLEESPSFDNGDDLLEDEQDRTFNLPRGHVPQAYLDFSNTDVASMDQHLPSSNIGYKLLMKMGWQAGQGLGKSQQGRRDPIKIETKSDSLGVGKQEEEDYYHVTTTAKRKALDSEKIAEETEVERMKRENKVMKQESIKKELETINSAFYCSLCDKQYTKISEYETHLSSYDHNHRKRFKDMKDLSRSSRMDKKREKERKREEKELARIQQAALQKAGNKQAASSSGSKTIETTSSKVDFTTKVSSEHIGKSSADDGGGWSSSFNTASWTTVSSAFVPKVKNDEKGSGFSKGGGGWTTSASSTNDSTTGIGGINNSLASSRITDGNSSSIPFNSVIGNGGRKLELLSKSITFNKSKGYASTSISGKGSTQSSGGWLSVPTSEIAQVENKNAAEKKSTEKFTPISSSSSSTTSFSFLNSSRASSSSVKQQKVQETGDSKTSQNTKQSAFKFGFNKK
ncbi:788_t:CDS:2 [Ambispora gerdemannii]|uniref:788_t:CDS:1 n=1 Tax=Ambispora gerdemannii TaxID=144530 RepID=A0A9N8VH62_9GLOM|nr:788_t:CDS:2 [Ambispora gerdemannii]